MTRQTTSRAAFTRDAAEIAAEASEDALAREVAHATFHPRPRPAKRPSALHKAAVGAGHVTAVSAICGATLYSGSPGLMFAGLLAYTFGATVAAVAAQD